MYKQQQIAKRKKRLAKFLNFSFYLIFSLPLYATEVDTFTEVMDLVGKSSPEKLMGELRSFVAAGAPTRMVGTEGHSNAKDYIATYLSEKAPTGKVTRQDFDVPKDVAISLYQSDFANNIENNYPADSETYIKWKNFLNYISSYITKHSYKRGQNILWEKKGSSDKTLVLVAHYDTIAQDKSTFKIIENENLQGADYNASGVAILLELVKLLNNISLKHTVQIAFLDYQGLGFLGSYIHAKQLAPMKKNILGVVNLEMLGHDSTHFDKKKRYGNMAVYLRSATNDPDNSDLKFLNNLTNKVKNKINEVKFLPVRNDFNQSDNFRYWEQGIACVTFSQNWEDDFNARGYQSSNDFAETLNYKTYFASFKYIAVAGILKLLDID